MQKSGINTNLLFTLLFCYQSIIIFQGIDLADTGFYATFYQQIFKDPQSVTYCFMFWLSGILGGFFMKLFPLTGLLGLRFLWVLVYMATIISTYQLLKKHISPIWLKLSLSILTLNLNNDPKEFYYNNFSSLLYVLTAILLFNGLKNNRQFAIFSSGVLVSLNMFNRFPNILGIGLCLAILYYGYTTRQEIKNLLRNTFHLLAGFILTSVSVILIMKFCGHLQIYMNALKILAGLGKSATQIKHTEDYYSISKMIKTIISHWLLSIIAAGTLIITVLVYYSLENKFKTLFPKFNIIPLTIKIILFLCLTSLIVSGKINNITVVYLFTGLCLIVGSLMIFFTQNKEINLLLFIGIFILLVHPMGSSEGNHTVEIYSFWIIFPIVLDRIMLVRFVNNTLKIENANTPFTISFSTTDKQLAEAKKIILALSIFTCFFYTYFYPHSDWENRSGMHYTVNNKFMTGIYTTKGRAEVIDQLLEASSKFIKPNDYVLAYDCMSLFYYMTETRPYTRNPWPWLYQSNTFKKELETASGSNNKLPVIVMQTVFTLGEGKNWPTINPIQDFFTVPVNMERNKVLMDFINTHHYKEVWANGYFKIFTPANELVR